MKKYKFVILAVTVSMLIAIYFSTHKNITTPTFLRRTNAASLTEMMRQPPTNIYGSSINVFIYNNEAGQPDEVVVTGHADSVTCSQTSGAIMGQILTRQPNSTDFLLAGAGRMIGARTADDENLSNSPTVQEYIKKSLMINNTFAKIHVAFA